MASPDADRRPLALLLLPAALQRFILRDQVRDLLRSEQVVAIEPGSRAAGAPGAGLRALPPGALGRLPPPLAAALARRAARAIATPSGDPRVLVLYHPLQLPLAEALRERFPRAQLWYARWDRYEYAYDAGPRLRRRLAALHERAAAGAALTFAVSGALVALEREAGRDALLAPTPHDSFPAPEPARAVVAISLGHLGHRTDWALLRGLAERMPELVLLLAGEAHPDECRGDPDYAACRAHPGIVWLGALDDERAARMILCADAGIVPFKREPFNDAGLPQRIVKYARLGRATISPPLAGVRTWQRAVTVAASLDEWVAALRAHAGAHAAPDAGLREWALAQTGQHQNRALWERLEALGIATPPERAPDPTRSFRT